MIVGVIVLFMCVYIYVFDKIIILRGTLGFFIGLGMHAKILENFQLIGFSIRL